MRYHVAGDPPLGNHNGDSDDNEGEEEDENENENVEEMGQSGRFRGSSKSVYGLGACCSVERGSGSASSPRGGRGVGTARGGGAGSRGLGRASIRRVPRGRGRLYCLVFAGLVILVF